MFHWHNRLLFHLDPTLSLHHVRHIPLFANHPPHNHFLMMKFLQTITLAFFGVYVYSGFALDVWALEEGCCTLCSHIQGKAHIRHDPYIYPLGGRDAFWRAFQLRPLLVAPLSRGLLGWGLRESRKQGPQCTWQGARQPAFAEGSPTP